MAASLRALISPYLLRREKKLIFQNGPTESLPSTPAKATTPGPTTPARRIPLCTARKHDLVVWLQLSELQLQLYKGFLGSGEVQNVLNCAESPLAALTVLKKICNHPSLCSYSSSSVPVESTHSQNSVKIAFLMRLLPNLHSGGHRILIFSQWVCMLDIIQSGLVELGYKFIRIDGSITNTAGTLLFFLLFLSLTILSERERRIKMFNSDRTIFCFLLTTGVGALGLNLTTADRVLICMLAFVVPRILTHSLLQLILVGLQMIIKP